MRIIGLHTSGRKISPENCRIVPNGSSEKETGMLLSCEREQSRSREQLTRILRVLSHLVPALDIPSSGISLRSEKV